jgi:Resolvase, N terminal domain
MDPAKVEVSPAIPLPVALSSALVCSMRAATYARVSTLEQDEALQHDALVAAGCQRVFVDKASGKLQHRPALDAMFEQLRPGDSVTVWRLGPTRQVPPSLDRHRGRSGGKGGGVPLPDREHRTFAVRNEHDSGKERM